ncbi:MAG: zinc dependent phospholipase C family protein [Ruminococcus sp.]|nr:zinc dependent phospholipase C family protein [Ruminococcus sp.]MDY3895593.1 zinc dependent phospholipase C family protein [Candidatus Fimenecus sp.]
MKFKTAISLLLSMVLLGFTVFTVPAFAEDTFDINDYSIEDLQYMTPEEKIKLISDYVNTYNPMGIKDVYNSAEVEYSNMLNSEVSPLWKSSNDSDDEFATHQLITLQAFLCSINDCGFYETDGTTALAISLTLAAASGLPDKEFAQKASGFVGHFYNPDTQKNWAGSKSNTAKTNCQKHFTNAITRLQQNTHPDLNGEDFQYVLIELGKALHYVQDASEPHHSNNKLAGSSSHTQFETFANENISKYIDDLSHCTAYYYNVAGYNDADGVTHEAAVISKPYYKYVSSLTDRSTWDYGALHTTQNAVGFSAGLIYRLFSIRT